MTSGSQPAFSRESLLDLLDLGQSLMFDLDGRIIHWTSGCQRLYGYSAQEAVGRISHELLKTRFPQPLAEIRQQLDQTGHWEGELVHLHRDGHAVTVASLWVLHRDASGKPLAILEANNDITQLRRAEDALRQTEAATFDSPAVGITYTDRDGRWLRVNRKLCQTLGYSKEELVGRHFADFTHPEDRAEDLRQYARMMQGEFDSYTIEKRHIRKDGQPLWVRALRSAQRDESGRPAYAISVSIIEDIAARKQAEEALLASRQRLAGIIDSAIDAIVTTDEQQRVVLFNPAAERMFGCPAGEALGSPIDRFIPHRFRAAHAHYIRHFGQTGQTSRAMGQLGAISGLRCNGEEFPIEASISQVDAGGGKLFSVILRDITARKAMEEELRQNVQRFRIMGETIPYGVWMCNAQGGDMYVSPAFLELLGLTIQEVQELGWTHRMPPEDLEAFTQKWMHCVHTGEDWEGEFRIRTPDGDYRTILARGKPVRNTQGRIMAWAGINLDITGRKRMEEVLAGAKVAAEAANQAKDRFMAILSHELRTPLTPVLATATMLEQDPRLDEDLRQSIEVIRRNAELEARLIDDLLDVTRIARGKVELDRRPVAICTILQRTAEVCMPDIEARSLHFGLDIKDPPHIVHADAGRMQQVFWNLLRNAVKFTPPGGCVGIRCWRENGQVITEVNDSGMGIDPDVLPHIFKPFEQGGVYTTQRFGGLGLGLAISKALVERHGGTIEVRSEGKDKGATFTVRLPLHVGATPSVPVAVSEDEETARRASPLRILLVEDHGDTARIMRRLLEASGHEVATAADVATALKLAGEQPFDLMLSDLGLPDGSGLDLMRAMRTKGINLPGIALSGYGQEQDMEHSLEAGFAAHITKPVNIEQVLRAITAVTGAGSPPPPP